MPFDKNVHHRVMLLLRFSHIHKKKILFIFVVHSNSSAFYSTAALMVMYEKYEKNVFMNIVKKFNVCCSRILHKEIENVPHIMHCDDKIYYVNHKKKKK
jgi:hypothetical protein